MVLRVPVECILMLGYAVGLALIAMLLESAARHAHQRALGISTIGFTYHADRDVWRCPEDKHLFPIFADSIRGTVVYRAPAETCNACRSKAACTDSYQGREIERKSGHSLRYGMERFHRGISLMLLILASLILVIEIFRSGGIYPRAMLLVVLCLFCAVGRRLSSVMVHGVR